MSVHARQKSSRKTISGGFQRACLRRAETSVGVIAALEGAPERSASCRSTCSQVKAGVGISGAGGAGQIWRQASVSWRKAKA